MGIQTEQIEDMNNENEIKAISNEAKETNNDTKDYENEENEFAVIDTKPEVDWPIQPEKKVDEEKEVSAATENKDILTVLLESHSDWFKLKKTVAILKRFIQYLQAKTLQKEELKSVCTPISAEDLQQAEHAILKYVQMHCLEKEVSCIQNEQT